MSITATLELLLHAASHAGPQTHGTVLHATCEAGGFYMVFFWCPAAVRVGWAPYGWFACRIECRPGAWRGARLFHKCCELLQAMQHLGMLPSQQVEVHGQEGEESARVLSLACVRTCTCKLLDLLKVWRRASGNTILSCRNQGLLELLLIKLNQRSHTQARHLHVTVSQGGLGRSLSLVFCTCIVHCIPEPERTVAASAILSITTSQISGLGFSTDLGGIMMQSHISQPVPVQQRFGALYPPHTAGDWNWKLPCCQELY